MPAKQRDRYKLFETKPALGGALITRGSLDNCGSFNYSAKRNFRRDLDQEIRREGHDYFFPNVSIPIAGQPFPSQITLSSLTFAGGVVTATRQLGQHFEVGETVIITGATDPLYNGSHVITATTATTFQYAITGTPVSPDTSTAIFAQADEEITLLALARRPNGKTAVIAGSQRRLYRYYALDDGNYISKLPKDYPPATPPSQLMYWSENPADYPALQIPEYIDSNPGYWIVIGSGFSTAGKRWETVSINGYMVFNNSVDLLCTYRVEELSVVPIYELREQGIASVGTISEINGILVCGDITEIQADQMATWFKTAGQIQLDSLTFAAGVVTATRAAGISYQVGEAVIVSGATHAEYNGVQIVATVTPTTFTYAITGTPASPDPSTAIYAVDADNSAPYGRYPYDQYLQRTVFRFIWGTPGEPRRWAALVPGSITAGSNILTLDYPVKGFSVGQSITIPGAGTPHAGGTSDNLTADIIYITGPIIVIDGFAGTTVTSVPVGATDAIGSIVGQEDLQDDGSGILKMLPLADQLVIYKDTSIFLAQYLGSASQPFAFAPRRIQKEQSLYFRNTLWLAETPTEMFHIYAGRNSFYRFDLTNQQPMIIPHFESCSNIFYEQVSLEKTEQIFAAENGITHEILWVFPSNNADQALLWDYKQDTISTTDAVITAACTVRKPLTGPPADAEQDWFIMGTAHGVVLLYGLTTEDQPLPDWGNGKQIFFRREANPYDATRNSYASTMTSGYGSFGNDSNEKDCRFFLVLMASQSPNTPITVSIYGAQNANLAPTLVATKNLPNPQTQNMVPLLARRFYLQSTITLTGKDNPLRLVGSAWSVAPVDSRSFSRA